jgi:hypothetical protein
MTNRLNDLIPSIIDAYATTYPHLIADEHTPAMIDSRDRMTSDIADAIIASASILADACRMTSDSMIDTANAMITTLNALNAIAYCDDLTTDDMTALRTHLDADLIRDLHNCNCDDSAIFDATFFAPIFAALPDDDDDRFELILD